MVDRKRPDESDDAYLERVLGASWRRIPWLAFIAALALLVTAMLLNSQPRNVGAQACGVRCGSERWPVKTLTDADTGQIDPGDGASSVLALRQVHAPPRDSLPQDGRVAPFETHLYAVSAVLVGWKLEADSDLHLVIAEPRHLRATMVAEIPAAGCARVCA